MICRYPWWNHTCDGPATYLYLQLAVTDAVRPTTLLYKSLFIRHCSYALWRSGLGQTLTSAYNDITFKWFNSEVLLCPGTRSVISLKLVGNVHYSTKTAVHFLSELIMVISCGIWITVTPFHETNRFYFRTLVPSYHMWCQNICCTVVEYWIPHKRRMISKTSHPMIFRNCS